MLALVKESPDAVSLVLLSKNKICEKKLFLGRKKNRFLEIKDEMIFGCKIMMMMMTMTMMQLLHVWNWWEGILLKMQCLFC